MRPTFKLAMVLLTVGVFVAIFFIIGQRTNHAAARMRDEETLPSRIEAACLNYYLEYGRLPPASDNQKLAAALLGENSHHIVFLSLASTELTSNREIVDRWGTPLRIEFQGTSDIVVTSAGSDKVFGTMDDVIARSSERPNQ